jgi:PAS domain S-box-containing protein
MNLQTHRGLAETSRENNGSSEPERAPIGSHPYLSRLAQIAQVTASTVIITDVDGRIVWVNESFTRITGYSFEEAVGHSPGALLQGAETDPIEKARIGAAIRARQPVAGELINYSKTGRRYWVGMKVEPIKNASGEIDGFMAIMADISERHEKQLQLELLTKRLNIATRNARVGLFERNLQEQSIWWNPVMYDIAGRDPHSFCPTVSSWLALVHEDDRERVRATAGNYDRPRTATTIQYRIVLPDGAVRQIESIASCDNGNPTSLAGIVLDVTARVESETRERALQQQLRQLSHQAGMAEIATGVLHNVGNVLNSLGIANSTALRGVKSLRIDGLEKASALIQEHRTTLQAFLTRDDRGRHLPDYLSALSRQLSDNVRAVHTELAATARLLQHLRDIISTQQTIARVGGPREAVDLRELIESALSMQPLESLQIDIVREYEEVAPIMTDRHKLLQIVVNLVSNACDAVSATHSRSKRIHARLHRQGDAVVIQIEDSGIGMSEEMLARLWRFGYTTKPHGHGFGLHNSANAAREIGATLTAHSDGIGGGARFTIQLPILAASATADGMPA